MNEQLLEKRQKKINALKVIFCIFTVALCLYVFTCEGFEDFFFTKTYDVPATYTAGKVSCESKGNLLAYVTTETGKKINFDMETTRGEMVSVPLSDYYRGYEGEQMSLHFVYTWITLSSVVLIVFRSAFMLMMIYMLCYAIWNFEKGVGLFKQGGMVRWPAAVTMAGTMLLNYNPLSETNTKLTEFTRYIGIGVALDYDISKVISNFMRWTLSFVVLCFLFMMFFRLIGERDKDEEERACWEFMHRFFVLAMILLILRCTGFFTSEEQGHALFTYSGALTELILFAFFLYFVLHLSKKITFEGYYLILAAAGVLSMPLAAVFSDSWSNGRALFAMQFAFVIAICVLIRLLPAFKKATFPLWTAVLISSVPLVTFIYIEFIAVLNQHSVFIAAVGKFYAIGMILMAAAAVLPPVFIKSLRPLSGRIRSVCYPVLVAGIAALAVQPAATAVYEADLYETANYSVLIGDFLNHGIFPIVGHYGGHMMTGVWEGIIYGLLNGNIFDASMSPYAGCIRILTTLCFFYLVKILWDEDMAFFAALFFPFSGCWNYFGQGMLIALAILSYAKKNTFGKAVWIWIAFAWVALYRLDMGASFGVAMVVALFAYCIIGKNTRAVKELLLSLLAVAATAAIIWCVLCMLNNVNPIIRLMEFLRASASNLTWGRNRLGDMTRADFAWGYLFIPMGVALCLGYTIISRRFREDAGEDRYLLLVIFGAAYIANIQRGLVRHTLAVDNYDVVLWSSLVFFAIFISVKRTSSTFLPAFGLLMILSGLLGNKEVLTNSSVIEQASVTLSSHIDAWRVDRVSKEDAKDEAESLSFWELTAVQGNVLERVQLDEASKEHIDLFVRAMDLLLDEGETYLDFENHTFLYTATGREDPVYVSQSPMQLSGEFMQRQFIEEIESKNVPFAILPATGNGTFASVRLDGLDNIPRYYLISEYIYENFRPFCIVGKYAIWVRPERYEEKLSRISVLEETEQIDNFVAGFSFSHLEMDIQEGSIVLTAVKGDPFIAGLEKCIDLSGYVGGTARFLIDYNTTAPGELKLYYTTEENETFSEAKVSKVAVSKSGTAELFVPVTAYTKLRMDIPDESTFVMTSLRTASCLEMIDYGYDIFYESENPDMRLADGAAHHYELKHLPRLWAERDKYESANGELICELEKNGDDGLYECEPGDSVNESCYLLMELTYSGRDDAGNPKNDDEYIEADLLAGEAIPTGIKENVCYRIFVNEGTHYYLIRLSSDYCWRTGGMTAFRLDCIENVDVGDMRLIKGD